MKQKNNPGTSIKCRFSNQVHKLLEPNINLKARQRWRNKKELTEKEKLEIFDQIVQLHNECSSELTSYLFQRRENKRLQKQRAENGYVPKKKKTTKEDYLKSLEKVS